MLRSTSADHSCRPGCLITDSLYNLMLLESLAPSAATVFMLQIYWKIKQQVGAEQLTTFHQKKFNNSHGLNANEQVAPPLVPRPDTIFVKFGASVANLSYLLWIMS